MAAAPPIETGRGTAVTPPRDAAGIPWPLTAGRAPDAAAVVTPRRVLSYAGLEQRSAVLAGALARRGIAAGDRVGLLLAAGPETVALFWALWRLGAVACPLSSRLPAGPLADMLAGIGARLLVTDRPWSGTTAAVALDELAAERVTPAAAGGALPLARPATVLFTSGSTGRPKAVLHTAGNHYFSARGANANLPLAPGHRWLLSLPLYHAGGLAILWRSALAGAALALDDPGTPLAASMADLAPSHLSLVPTQLRRLMAAPTPPAGGRLAGILVGGAALPPGLLAEARARGLPVVATYGCTEAASQVTATATDDPPAALQTAGRVLAHRAVRIAADGEILVRGRTLAAGYLEGDAVVPLTDAAGWYHTGDLGAWDDTGRLRITGRRDGLIISGGENIHPEAVEIALGALAGIGRCAVVGVPDPDLGHRPVAFVELADGGIADTADIRARLEAAGSLARFMLPVRVLPWPAGAAGDGVKPDRRALAALAAAAVQQEPGDEG